MPYKDKEKARQRSREYYHVRKEARKEYDKAHRPRLRQLDALRRWKRKQEAVELLGSKCADCGNSYPLACYDFHHLNPEEKEFDPCSGLTKKKEKFLAELKKCILLCANCHRIRHFKYETI